MLQFIRDHAQGWIAWVIVSLLIVVFSFWGINTYFDATTEVNAAEVDGAEIPVQEFQQAYQQERQRFQTLLGNNFDPAMFDGPEMKNRVLEKLINEEVQAQAAEQSGYRVGDQRLASEIATFPDFQNNGKFDAELYDAALRGQGLTPAGFEQRLRKALVVEQAGKGLVNSSFMTEGELKNLLRLQKQKRSVGYVVLPSANFSANQAVDDKAINDYYTTHRDDFVKPERVTVNYVELSAASLGQQIPVDDALLHKLYDEQKSNYMTEETRRARHILISVKPDADEKTVGLARAKAQGLLDRILAGESLEVLAKQNSEDPGSANLGGDLGYFGRGIMDKAFEASAFALPVGGVSDVVKSNFGFHILQLVDIKPGQTKPFDEVKAKLASDYRQDKAEERYFDMSEQLTDKAFASPDTLTAVAQELGLTIQTSDWISREQGTGVGMSPKVREVAFSEDVLRSGNNSEPIEIAPNHVVVLRVKDHEASSVRPLEEVKADIVRQLQSEGAKARAKAQGEALLADIRKGADVAATKVKEIGLEWKQPGLIGRDDAALDPAIRNALFKLARPKGAVPSFGGVALPSGDYAVLAVYAIEESEAQAMDEAAKKTLRDSEARNVAMIEFSRLVDYWRAKMKVVAYQDKL